MSGGGGGFGQALVNSGMRMGGQAPTPAQGGADYSAPAPMTPYASAFGSQQSPITSQQLTPFAQQMMQRSMAPNPMVQEAMGLQAALAQMGAQFNQPMMRSQFMSMPTYQNPALNYRPNLEGALQGLNRVAPSVELQQKQAAEEAARLAVEQAAQQPQYESHTIGGG
jgi:hypothetical protein